MEKSRQENQPWKFDPGGVVSWVFHGITGKRCWGKKQTNPSCSLNWVEAFAPPINRHTNETTAVRNSLHYGKSTFVPHMVKQVDDDTYCKGVYNSRLMTVGTTQPKERISDCSSVPNKWTTIRITKEYIAHVSSWLSGRPNQKSVFRTSRQYETSGRRYVSQRSI